MRPCGACRPSGPTPARRLRTEGLIAGRRDGKSVHYRLASEEARRVMMLLYELFRHSESGKASQPIGAAAD